MKSIILSLISSLIFSLTIVAQSQITVTPGDFSGFEISQPLDVYLHQSDSSYIQISGKNIEAKKNQY